MSKKSHSRRITATNNGVKRAFVKLLQNAVNNPAPFSTPTHQKGHDPIIDEYIAWRKIHPHGPLPQTLLDKVHAARPGVDLERVGKDFVGDMLSEQQDNGR